MDEWLNQFLSRMPAMSRAGGGTAAGDVSGDPRDVLAASAPGGHQVMHAWDGLQVVNGNVQQDLAVREQAQAPAEGAADSRWPGSAQAAGAEAEDADVAADEAAKRR